MERRVLFCLPKSKSKEEGRRKKEEGRRKKEEGRRKKEEGRRKKEEGRRKKEEYPSTTLRVLLLGPNRLDG
jgi:hypothetical protein